MSNLEYPIPSSKIVNPLSVTLQTKTLKGTKFEPYGTPKRKSKREFVLRRLGIKHVGLTPSDIETAYQFFTDMRGSYESFVFFFPYSWADRDYADEYVGEGDGSTTIFNLPIKSGSSYSIYVDNVEQVDSVDYDYTVGAGASGEDRIVFDSGSIPENGALITMDVTGRLKLRVFFTDDELTAEEFSDILVNSSLTLQGELNS